MKISPHSFQSLSNFIVPLRIPLTWDPVEEVEILEVGDQEAEAVAVEVAVAEADGERLLETMALLVALTLPV